jgi:hypothetical protein
MRLERNDPCPCGSGWKYKQCCAVRRTPSQWAAIISVVAFGLVAVWVVGGVIRDAATDGLTPPGKVWSAEHGHWHDVPTPGAEPPDEAPPGKVWSTEHGHWHDLPAGGALPPGPAPPGKVWSVEHGHWHDAAGANDTEPSPDPATP